MYDFETLNLILNYSKARNDNVRYSAVITTELPNFEGTFKS